MSSWKPLAPRYIPTNSWRHSFLVVVGVSFFAFLFLFRRLGRVYGLGRYFGVRHRAGSVAFLAISAGERVENAATKQKRRKKNRKRTPFFDFFFSWCGGDAGASARPAAAAAARMSLVKPSGASARARLSGATLLPATKSLGSAANARLRAGCFERLAMRANSASLSSVALGDSATRRRLRGWSSCLPARHGCAGACAHTPRAPRVVRRARRVCVRPAPPAAAAAPLACARPAPPRTESTRRSPFADRSCAAAAAAETDCAPFPHAVVSCA